MQMTIKCARCKEESVVKPYFFDTAIHVSEDIFAGRRSYMALTTGKAICPKCGETMCERYSQSLYLTDIEALATGMWCVCDNEAEPQL
jgi:hypothetical protein